MKRYILPFLAIVMPFCGMASKQHPELYTDSLREDPVCESVDTKEKAVSAAPYRLVLSSDKEDLVAGSGDMVRIIIRVEDKDGIPSNTFSGNVKLQINGAGSLEPVVSEASQTSRPIRKLNLKLVSGETEVLVRAGQKKGTLKLKVSSKGLKSAKFRIPVKDKREVSAEKLKPTIINVEIPRKRKYNEPH